MTTFFTIGYQGHVIESFVGSLAVAQVNFVLDVRRTPLSRKKGFSKNVLAGHLAAAGIGYAHHVDLGTPHELREQVRRSKDYDAFQEAYRAHLLAHEDALRAALPLLYAHRTCLLCFEQRVDECHRLVVAQELIGLDSALEVVHL
jgi:uncharacterized protein (DUF488 family)